MATVERVIEETPRVKTIVLDTPEWPGHIAGQYVDVRLADETGYQTERAYSIASAPEHPQLALSVERIPDGEVSGYLTEHLCARDTIELRGPVGAYFTWRVDDGGPLLLIAGGSGLVPLMAMLRHRAARSSEVDARLLVSARSLDDALYRDELETLAAADGVLLHRTFTREPPVGWTGFARRIDAQMLSAVGPAPKARPRIFVCGPTAFVERADDLLIELGHDPTTIRSERFGPTGG